MIEKDTNIPAEPLEVSTLEFVLHDARNASSAELIGSPVNTKTSEIPVIISEENDVSPVFKELSSPKLPELAKENRAKLLMQTPNRLFFYWSAGKSPFHTLHDALGDETGGYTLVVKLVNLNTDREELFAVDAEGSWWFDVEADARYQAEIGFYATNRPYVRVMYSNIVNTPRKSPSPRAAASSDWNVTAEKFAEVLDVAGFSQDAFDVAIAGDDADAAETATQAVFAKAFGGDDIATTGIAGEEIRFALLALASGVPLEYLRFRISPGLFAILNDNLERLSRDNTVAALREHFDVETSDILEEETGPAVFGASLIHFPRILKKNHRVPKFISLSSHSVGSKSL